MGDINSKGKGEKKDISCKLDTSSKQCWRRDGREILLDPCFGNDKFLELCAVAHQEEELQDHTSHMLSVSQEKKDPNCRQRDQRGDGQRKHTFRRQNTAAESSSVS